MTRETTDGGFDLGADGMTDGVGSRGGPRTAEGKARSPRNAVKHGFSGKNPVGPGQDPAEYEAKLAKWVAEMRPVGELEFGLVETACRASWVMRWVGKADDANLSRRERYAVDTFDDQETARAEGFGHDLYVGLGITPGKPRAGGVSPTRARSSLETFWSGAVWLLEEWNDLAAGLESRGAWTDLETRKAYALAGPGACGALVAAHSGPGGGASAEVLGGVAAAEVARLEELVEGRLASLYQADRAEAPERAYFDPGREASKLRRYESDARRAFFRASRELALLRRAREATAVSPQPSPTSPPYGFEAAAGYDPARNRVVPPRPETPVSPPPTPSRPVARAAEDQAPHETTSKGRTPDVKPPTVSAPKAAEGPRNFGADDPFNHLSDSATKRTPGGPVHASLVSVGRPPGDPLRGHGASPGRA